MNTKKKMLVALVDDDEDDRFFFKRAIDEVNIETELLLFRDGQDFMDFLNASESLVPHIVFLDLNMPKKDGMECLQEIRSNERFNKLTVAIYSTSSSEADIKKTFVLGANIYINKPRRLSELKKGIETVLSMNWHYETSRLEKENFLLRI